MMQTHSSRAPIPTGPRIQRRARPLGPPPCNPRRGATYLTALIGRNEIDGGVGGTRSESGETARPSGDKAPHGRYQARPVDVHSRPQAESAAGRSPVFVQRKDAQLNALRFSWLGTITPRPNRVFNALGRRVKPSLQGFSFCSPRVLADLARDSSDFCESVLHGDRP